MNTAGLVGGLIFAVICIVFLAKHLDEKKQETIFNEDEEEM